MRRLAIWVACCGGGTLLGYVAGKLHALTVPDCAGVCPLPYPPFEVMQRMRIVATWTLAGFTLGVSLAVILQLWALHKADRSRGTLPRHVSEGEG